MTVVRDRRKVGIVSDVSQLFQPNHDRQNKHLSFDFIDYTTREQGLSPATTRSYKYVLTMFNEYLAGRDLTSLTIRDVMAFFTKCEETHKITSVNTYRATLRTFLRYCYSYRDIKIRFDPALIKNKKTDEPETKYITPELLRTILDVLEEPQDRLIIATFYATGLRIGELVKLKVEDIGHNELRVKGKGGRRRVIPIPDVLQRALHEHLYDNNISVGVVFRHAQTKSTLPNSAYTVSGLRKRIQRKLAKHGIHVNPHWLRHGSATILHENGMDIRTLQVFLGHSHIATTQRYTHVTNSKLRKEFNECFPVSVLNL